MLTKFAQFKLLITMLPQAVRFSSRLWGYGFALCWVRLFDEISLYFNQLAIGYNFLWYKDTSLLNKEATGDALWYLLELAVFVLVIFKCFDIASQVYQGHSEKAPRYLAFDYITAKHALKFAIIVCLWVVLPSIILSLLLDQELSLDTESLSIGTIFPVVRALLLIFVYPAILITYLRYNQAIYAINPKYWRVAISEIGIEQYISLLVAYFIIVAFTYFLGNYAFGFVLKTLFGSIKIPFVFLFVWFAILSVVFFVMGKLFAILMFSPHCLLGYVASGGVNQKVEVDENEIIIEAMRLFKKGRIDEVILLAESALQLEQYNGALKIASHFIKTHNHHADLLDMQIVAGRALVGKNHLQKAYHILGKAYKQLDKSDARYSELRKELLALKQRIEHTASARKNAQ